MERGSTDFYGKWSVQYGVAVLCGNGLCVLFLVQRGQRNHLSVERALVVRVDHLVLLLDISEPLTATPADW